MPIALLCSLTLLAGCAGVEFTPTGRALFIHKELPAADRAVEAARSSGKAAQCPDAFQEAEQLRDQAYVVYWQCHTAEAIALANSATAKANALCPPKVEAPPPARPTTTISANPASIQAGACTTLTWTSTNASSASIDPGLGSVSVSGSQQVCPTSTTQYAITATGAGGRATASTSVTVMAPEPTVTISANPASIQAGACTTLTWTSTNASSASIDPGVGSVAVSGSQQVCPTSTTQYGIAATGAGGRATASTSVTVTAAPPTATISANPASIQAGACTTLTWTSTNASSATIDPGLGSVAVSGSQQVCPPSSTQYAIAATGAGGRATASTTVTVAPKVIDRLTIHVNFDFDKAVIRNADLPDLQKALAFVKKYPGHKVSIEGHTDSIGTVPYNQRLSERRAAAVKDWLVSHGGDAARMQTVGYGKLRPVADNSTPDGRFKNRRVEILIMSE
ncbi:MAG: hypothetical protein C5B48_04685 [Candidatus Rokuibacteriota bacterium]|nr:MAG: hypothetical protein C5B48_04685 [Candidatus Rokubacteria bacterium]